MPLTVSLIVAADENRVIGLNGDLPWRLPNDLKHFKALTVGKTVLMGRKTWESLGRPLPNRQNWVVSRNPAFQAPGARLFVSLEAALRAAADEGAELMVIGGVEIFRLTLPQAQRIYLTQVHAQVDGDTWFPPCDASKFRECAREYHPADADHAHAYSFVTLERSVP